jgi:hypothetical protein
VAYDLRDLFGGFKRVLDFKSYSILAHKAAISKEKRHRQPTTIAAVLRPLYGVELNEFVKGVVVLFGCERDPGAYVLNRVAFRNRCGQSLAIFLARLVKASDNFQ